MGSDLGLGLKYMITPNIVADVAFNPDFSQVEADAAQIDVNTTFALFFPEPAALLLGGRRPVPYLPASGLHPSHQ